MPELTDPKPNMPERPARPTQEKIAEKAKKLVAHFENTANADPEAWLGHMDIVLRQLLELSLGNRADDLEDIALNHYPGYTNEDFETLLFELRGRNQNIAKKFNELRGPESNETT